MNEIRNQARPKTTKRLPKQQLTPSTVITTIVIFSLLLKGANQQQPAYCQIRDTYDFRDIIIVSNSSRLASIYSHKNQITNTTTYISICSSIPSTLTEGLLKTCPGYSKHQKDHFFLKIQEIFNPKTKKVKRKCLLILSELSITMFRMKASPLQYNLSFTQNTGLTKIVFPANIPGGSDIDYEYNVDTKTTTYRLRGSKGDVVIEEGYFTQQLHFGFYLGFKLFVLVYIVRFAILSKEDTTYTSIFICGKRMNFFHHFLNYFFFFELLNAIFQIYAGPTPVMASLVIAVIPVQMSMTMPLIVTKYVIKCRFP